MGVAEELAEVWRDVPGKPQPGKEAEYFALLLRLTLDSKKRVDETGRRYATLPSLRDLIRKRIVRAPAEHVKWLEISAFDLVANPLKKSLSAYVIYLREEDVPLVEWFVHAAKKDPSLGLGVGEMDAWLRARKPMDKPIGNQPGPSSNQEAESTSVTSVSPPFASLGSPSTSPSSSPPSSSSSSSQSNSSSSSASSFLPAVSNPSEIKVADSSKDESSVS